MKYRIFLALFCILSFSISNLVADTVEGTQYRIQSVIYEVDGITKIYPLSRSVHIDTTHIFQNREDLNSYLEDLHIKFQNQRVLESVLIEPVFTQDSDEGIVLVSLKIQVVDTWNIIAMPYPKYDSNTGFQFKLKLKDYNFFGTMQELNSDIVYEVDDTGKSTLGANIKFAIPFEFMKNDMEWTNNFSVLFPIDEIPEFIYTTAISFERHLGIYVFNFALTHKTAVNSRANNILREDDPLYFSDSFSVKLPIRITSFNYFGDLNWTPSASIGSNWAPKGIQDDTLKGPSFTLNHSFSLGRIDWIGNFRQGIAASISNSWNWNFHFNDGVRPDLELEIKGYKTFFDRIGLTSRLVFFHSFYDTTNDTIAKELRGIENDRIETKSAITFNIDMPIRILRINFLEMTGVSWTKYISFEMHASPFFDMALTHDPKTDRVFNLADGWYAGGLEMIIYPMKMRSIYGRIMAGVDIPEVIKNGGKTSLRADRDGSAIREIFIGIGLQY